MTEGTPGRGHNGRFERHPDTAERDAAAARLRGRGETYQAIADQLGFDHRSGARRAVERAMTATVAEPSAEVRARELERLDDMHAAALRVLETSHVLVSQGRVIKDDDGKPMADDAPVLNAIDRLLKIQDRRAKLLGLDQPTKINVSPEADSDFDRAYRELIESMAPRPDVEPSE